MMQRSSPAPASLLALTVLAALLVSGSCGRKSVPLPPLVQMAEQTRDLRALQQGREAIIEWSYPALTTAGKGLDEVESVELWRATLPLGQEPQGTTQRDRDIKVQLLKAQGEVLVELDADGLDRATRGAELQVVDDLETWRQENRVEGQPLIWYAVRTRCCGGRYSAFSNIARLVPQLPPPPPTWVSAEGSWEGIVLSWTQAPELKTLVERAADGESWQALTANAIAETEYTDRAAAQGRSWHYRLRSEKAVEGGGRVVGEPSEPRVVEHPDLYPPEAPTNLVCLPEGETVRLRWDEAAGLSYRVSRSRDGLPAVLLDEAVASNRYHDTEPPFGRLSYLVRAVDDAGNQSPPASCDAVVGAEP